MLKKWSPATATYEILVVVGYLWNSPNLEFNAAVCIYLDLASLVVGLECLDDFFGHDGGLGFLLAI